MSFDVKDAEELARVGIKHSPTRIDAKKTCEDLLQALSLLKEAGEALAEAEQKKSTVCCGCPQGHRYGEHKPTPEDVARWRSVLAKLRAAGVLKEDR